MPLPNLNNNSIIKYLSNPGLDFYIINVLVLRFKQFIIQSKTWGISKVLY